MAARDEQQEIGEGQAVGETGAQRMGFQMIDRHEGLAQAERHGLGRGQADDQAADQARAGRRGDPVDGLEAGAGVGEGLANRRIEQVDMGAGGDFRHHPAIGRMEIELRAHHIGQDLAAPVDAPAHQGRGRLVAARLDAEHGQRGVGFVLSHAFPKCVRRRAIEGEAETGH